MIAVRLSSSLYLRLVLVLLLAMGASYATMYVLFLSHLEETRTGNFARTLAAQVRLVEELLQARPASGIPVLKTLRLAPAAPVVVASGPDVEERLARVREGLEEELGRDVKVLAVEGPEAGLWIDLRVPNELSQWLFIAAPRPHPHPHHVESMLPVSLVGFAVFFAGGMLLLWQVQRPLKRLGKALETVGKGNRLAKLAVTGGGEIRILGERYNDMVERLRAYEEDRATMLAGVAHDLRTPITRLRLLMELAQGSRHSEMEQNLADIERITEQFLVYARGGAGESVTERDIAHFLEEVVAPYAVQGVTATCVPVGAIVALRADALRRALINLVENAVEYGQAPILVRCCCDSASVSIAVEDAGSGIEASQIGRAMRPFARLDNSRRGKGHCGLGLVIAARIAEDHGGALTLRNGETGGFVAEIRFPLNPSS
jgi:two-component system osmolarity sensor histidine kinase EnvZ